MKKPMVAHNTTKYEIPESLIVELEAYGAKGEVPREFLYHVLCNSLCSSLISARTEEMRCIPDIVAYVSDELPQASWGSKNDVECWVKWHEEKKTMPLAIYKLKAVKADEKERKAMYEALKLSNAVVEEVLKHSFNTNLDEIRQKSAFALEGKFEDSLKIKMEKK